MKITWDDLIVDCHGASFNDLLSEWRWLVDEPLTPIIISALGDLFLRSDDGRIFWLDTGFGQLTEVADSVEDFRALMAQPENADQWFVPQLVGDLKASGKELQSGQCYSYTIPPILGGKIEPSNFEPTDLSVHFSILGQIHRQVKDLPEGAPITEIKIEGGT